VADTVAAETRSRIMSRIRAKNTAPEMAVRRYLHAHGFRYRLHDRRFPGTPDLVLPRYHAAVFVHGCFWHRHPGCRFAYTPKSRTEFWREKFRANVARDKRDRASLEAAHWTVLTVWECEIAENVLQGIADRITALDPAWRAS
jgi:DNA mismatch endonuclease (patch repair protein)